MNILISSLRVVECLVHGIAGNPHFLATTVTMGYQNHATSDRRKSKPASVVSPELPFWTVPVANPRLPKRQILAKVLKTPLRSLVYYFRNQGSFVFSGMRLSPGTVQNRQFGECGRAVTDLWCQRWENILGTYGRMIRNQRNNRWWNFPGSLVNI